MISDYILTHISIAQSFYLSVAGSIASIKKAKYSSMFYIYYSQFHIFKQYDLTFLRRICLNVSRSSRAGG